MRKLLMALMALSLVAAACGSDSDSSGESNSSESDETSSESAEESEGSDDATTPVDGPTIVIGAQDFGESAILAQIYGQALTAAGYDVSQQSLGGYRDLVYTSFESGDINFTAEYAASSVEFLNDNAGEASGDIDATASALRTHLESRGLVALDASAAVDSNSFVVTQATADDLGISAVSGLNDAMILGGPTDCPDNAACLPGLLSVYGLDLSAGFTPLDGGGPLTVAALEGGEIDVAILFSTNGTIADKGWVVLDDDKGLINADNIIPVMSSELTQTYGADFETLVNSISAALDTSGLTELNRQFGIELIDVEKVAADWLAANGFS